MVTSQCQRGIFKLRLANTKILHKAIMQAAFDHNGNFSRLTKLDNVIGFKRFCRTDSQGTAISQQIMRILNHIMTKSLTAECSLCQLLVKRQSQCLLVERKITLPNLL